MYTLPCIYSTIYILYHMYTPTHSTIYIIYRIYTPLYAHSTMCILTVCILHHVYFLLCIHSNVYTFYHMYTPPCNLHRMHTLHHMYLLPFLHSTICTLLHIPSIVCTLYPVYFSLCVIFILCIYHRV